MSKQVKKNLVPVLRFPEFVGNKEWALDELGKYLDYLQPTKYLVSSTVYDDKFKIPVLTAGKTFILGYTNENEGIFDKNLPVIIFDDFTTASKYVDFPFKAKSSAMKILLAKQNANIKFFYESMQLIKYQVGVHQRHWISIFSKIDIPVPMYNEQQKIANCLLSIDDLITEKNQKLEALKIHKKGLMQLLFPAEGEAVPKLRFPEFQISGNWKLTTFGKMARFFNGRAYKQSELLDKGKYRVLRVGNFFSNNEWYYSDLDLEENRYCDNGDLLYAWSASFGPRIWSGEKVIYHYHIWKIIENKNIDKKFLFILLDYETEKMKSQSANGLGILHITKKTIENWKCLLPPIKEEQQKIANCLSSIDELITIENQKLEALKSHKKGLIQQLFPVKEKVDS